MSLLDLVDPTLASSLASSVAFLAPLPPQRPEEPRPLPGNAWAAAVVIGGVCLIMVVPMVTIWGFHRPHDAFRARCEAGGGHVVPFSLDGSGPYRCDRGERRGR